MGYPVLGLLTHFHLAMATLAFGLLVYSFLVVGGEFTGGFSGIPGIPPFSIGPWVMQDEVVFYFWVWFLALALLVVAINIGRSQVGRVLKSIQDDEMAAKAVGISVGSYKLNIFVVSAMYSSVGGSLLAHYISHVSPSQFDMVLSMDLLVMDVLGGKGTLVGGILGAAFLKFLPQLTESFKDYRLLGNGIIVTMVLLFAPGGIVGLLRNLLFSTLTRRAVAFGRGSLRRRAVPAKSIGGPTYKGE
ncbi:MAG: branched-chain amino acid ABC transporter permease [Chloroflexi bacterium]|nr:branched-chain amino acid ABC transporter permease [Chloroflexota bacterium]